jgi:hypothetical protein
VVALRVGRVEQRHAARRLPVSARAADFLDVLLDGPGSKGGGEEEEEEEEEEEVEEGGDKP